MKDIIVFSKEWFEAHQTKLLWLLNHWLTRRWFRWVLCIRRCDIGYDKRIIELCPHAYTVLLGEEEELIAGELIADRKSNGVAFSTINSPPINSSVKVATDFRTHDKYAKRLYYALRPLWYVLHFWDWLLADRWVPRLSFGFSTYFTCYPDAGSGGTTCDGYVMRGNAVQESFATIRAGTGQVYSAITPSVEVRLGTATTTDTFSQLNRAFACFDVTRLGASHITILSADLSVWCSNKDNNFSSDTNLYLAGATPASNNTLVAGDYQQVQTTEFATSIAYTNVTTSSYNAFSLNASGLAELTGIANFSLQLGWDILNSFTGTWASPPTNLSYNLTNADTSGNSNDPKLVILYRAAGKIANQNTLRPSIFTPGHAR